MRTDDKYKKLKKKLKAQFLEKPANQELFVRYSETKDPAVLDQLTRAYSDYVNYTVLLSLIQTHVKYKSLHLKEQQQQRTRELVSEETLAYILDEKRASSMTLSLQQWDAVLEDEALIEAITSLTKRQQEVLWTLFVENIPVSQAAKGWGVSQQSVSKTKQRALKNIKQSLEELE